MGLWDQLQEKLEFDKINFYKNKKFQQITWLIVVLSILAGIVTIDLLPSRLQVGQVSEKDIKAPRTVTYVDQEEKVKAEARAVEKVKKQYQKQDNVEQKVLAKSNKFFSSVISLQQEQGTTNEKVKKLAQTSELKLSSEEYLYLLKKSPQELNDLKIDVNQLLTQQLETGVKSDELETAKNNLKQKSQELGEAKIYKSIVSSLTKQLIMPNQIYDQQLTQQKKSEARENIDLGKVTKTIHKGEVIIRHGKVVTSDDIEKLEALGLRSAKNNYLNIIGYIIVVLILSLLVVIYMQQYQPQLIENNGVISLLGLLPIIILLLANIAKYLPLDHPGYVVPVAACSIIIAILLDTNLAVIFTVILSFLVGLITNGGIADIAVIIVSGITGIYSVSELSQRTDLVRAGFIVGGVSSLTIFGFLLIENSLDLMLLLKMVPLGLLNGIIVAIVTNGFLPYVENVFGITSPVKLLELSNPNHPLLKKLLVEAPGTYHHSVIVGNLAEAAADKIGADSLLVRVGAYYHDIGKIKRAYFFTENQIGSENPHDKLSPNLSTLIITSHVKDGVELAQEYKLPSDVIDIIKQHHGTSLVSFFYQEAMHDEKYKQVDKDEFRYDGPKPQNKEAALIMLSDMVEAAVRANPTAQSNPGRLEKLVRDLIKQKLDSGQLNESDLTLKDLDKIAKSFVNILKGIFHNRIEYPDNLAKQFDEGGQSNGNSN
ncbi:HD family phosphohydrolase [Halanaerobacter jeridensis]|uniref:Nucleotidyltransferase with HDIG domain n=1 Tax=Halanaerobacter jeridensis TaxID=706427 RepID=A0A938XP62_9FIRM|nr:HDIG domain-containing metalloprotein [Halanaerobacter jeridensis]MBM7556242.1 putative nucleotidyltransferase with HDIG domain [Halanaerobacter jeridensis]